MAMTKKDFIALADVIKAQIARELSYPGAVQRPFTFGQINILADFCETQSDTFDRQRWLAYITDEGGKRA